MSPRLVIVESPFAGPTPADVARNVRYVRAAMRDSFQRGEAPFASHALYTLPGVLNDRVPAERAQGMAAGWAWLEAARSRADAVATRYVDLGISSGMVTGKEHADLSGLPTEERSLGPDWDRLDEADARHQGHLAVNELREQLQHLFDGNSPLASMGPPTTAREAWAECSRLLEAIVTRAKVRT